MTAVDVMLVLAMAGALMVGTMMTSAVVAHLAKHGAWPTFPERGAGKKREPVASVPPAVSEPLPAVLGAPPPVSMDITDRDFYTAEAYREMSEAMARNGTVIDPSQITPANWYGEN